MKKTKLATPGGISSHFFTEFSSEINSSSQTISFRSPFTLSAGMKTGQAIYWHKTVKTKSELRP
jgi:hypothetical protein